MARQRAGLSFPAPSAHLCARATATWRAQEAFGSSAVAHWPVEATPLPRPKAAGSSEPTRTAGPAVTTSPATTSTTKEVSKGEPTWAHGRTDGQAWGSRDVRMMPLSRRIWPRSSPSVQLHRQTALLTPLCLAQLSTSVPPAPKEGLQTPKLEAQLTPPAPGALPEPAPAAPPGDARRAPGDKGTHRPQL